MSRRYKTTLFIGALCTSYLALSAMNFSANAADKVKPAAKPTDKRIASEEESDSWRGKSVFERSREEYSTDGVYLGSFKFKPSIDISETYNSNIYARQSSVKGDTITKAKPVLALESDWSRHAMQFTASGDLGAYSSYSKENYGDYSVGTSGRLDILRETYILGAASTSHLHEDRGSPDSNTNSKSPTEYNLNNANISFMRNLRKVSLKIDGNLDEYGYENGRTNSGTVIRNNDRNRNEYKTTAKFGYEIIPDYEAFIRGSLNKRNYDSAVDQNGLNRDSNGYDTVVGTALNLGGKTKGEVFVGYMSQEYKSPTLKDVSAPQFGADVLWNATSLTSIKAGILRGVQETVSATSSGYISTTYSLALEHELQYNLLAGVNARYSVDDYQTKTAISRNDDIFGAGAEVRYLLNRNTSLIGKYDYTNRNSNLVGQDYDSNLVSLGLKLAM